MRTGRCSARGQILDQRLSVQPRGVGVLDQTAAGGDGAGRADAHCAAPVRSRAPARAPAPGDRPARWHVVVRRRRHAAAAEDLAGGGERNGFDLWCRRDPRRRRDSQAHGLRSWSWLTVLAPCRCGSLFQNASKAAASRRAESMSRSFVRAPLQFGADKIGARRIGAGEIGDGEISAPAAWRKRRSGLHEFRRAKNFAPTSTAMRSTARIRPMDWFFMSAERFGAVEHRAPQRTRRRNRRRCGRRRNPPRRRGRAATGRKRCAPFQRSACEVGLQQPGLIENGVVELRARKPRLDQTRRAQIDGGQIEAGEIEAVEAPEGEVRVPAFSAARPRRGSFPRANRPAARDRHWRACRRGGRGELQQDAALRRSGRTSASGHGGRGPRGRDVSAPPRVLSSPQDCRISGRVRAGGPAQGLLSMAGAPP